MMKSSSKYYVDEEVWSDFTYPVGYEVKSITEQIEILHKNFPQLSVEPTREFVERMLPMMTLPNGAEGWFAIPRADRIASSYNEAVEKIFMVIGSIYKFINYHEGRLRPQYLRQHERTVRMFDKLSEKQLGDILVIPAQFGLRHRGRSVRRTRSIFAANEFGLGSFSTSCMLITCPERLGTINNLWVDCSGDEYTELGNGKFSSAPCFGLRNSQVGFSAWWIGCASAYRGSVSGFLP